MQNLDTVARRTLLEESSNLLAVPIMLPTSDQIIALPSTRSSGSFPAVPKEKVQPPPPAISPVQGPYQSSSNPVSEPKHPIEDTGGHSGDTWKYLVGFGVSFFVLIIAAALFIVCRSRAVTTIGPWRTGLSGQLQKAFVTGSFSTSSLFLHSIEK